MTFRSLGHNRVSRIELDAWQFCQRLVDLYVDYCFYRPRSRGDMFGRVKYSKSKGGV